MLIEVDRELALYSEIKLDFDLPWVDYQARDVYAKIVGKKHDDDRILMGVEFTSVCVSTRPRTAVVNIRLG
ncbi:MAG: hypothetical protein ABIR98_03580 [Usitatibacter sp.]